MNLLKIENFELIITPEALSLKPFKRIWDRDKSDDKRKAIQDLSYIYFFSDPRSDYQYIIDKDDRKKAIMEGEGINKQWNPDKTILEGIKLYESMQPVSALLLKDTRNLVDRLRNYLQNIDLEAVDKNGKPIFALNTLTATIGQIPQLVTKLKEAEIAVAKDINEQSKARGQGDLSILDEDINL